jgi:hypothetical protein
MNGDQIEKALHSDALWYFLNNQAGKAQNRIGFLFDLVARTGELPSSGIQDEYWILYVFSQKLNIPGNTVKHEWLKTKQTFMELESFVGAIEFSSSPCSRPRRPCHHPSALRPYGCLSRPVLTAWVQGPHKSIKAYGTTGFGAIPGRDCTHSWRKSCHLPEIWMFTESLQPVRPAYVF